jgi:hydroxyacylglutathione hydrolase
MKIKTLSLGQLATNGYLVWEEKDQKALIIDPGDEGDFITQTILELKLKPQAILATHAHFDHVLAAFELQLNFKIPFYLHPKDVPILKYMVKSARYWLNLKNEPPNPPPKVDKFLKDKDQIKLGQEFFRVIHTPGHTPGSVCFHQVKEKLLFAGDTLFKDGFGRTDLSGGSSKDLVKSLGKLAKLPAETRVLPGHGEETTLGAEKENIKIFKNRKKSVY